MWAKKGVECWQVIQAVCVAVLCVSSVSRRPSGRLEVVQLMRMMDDMLEKAGVEGLLELVKVEQNIYNIVFHEVIRQVTVGCVERGQLLAKLRQRYQSLLDRIPRRLKALHAEAVAQRALDRRLTEEIYRIKASIELWIENVESYERAEKCDVSHDESAFLSVVQAYHDLYERHKARREAELLQMTEERDCWRQITVQLAVKVQETKMLIKVECSGQFGCLSFEELSPINSKDFYVLFLQMLAIQCDEYQGEKQLLCQQKLNDLDEVLEKWLFLSLQLFDRHPSPDFEAPNGQRVLRDLDRVLSEHLKQLGVQVSEESGESRQSSYTYTHTHINHKIFITPLSLFALNVTKFHFSKF
uniref:Axonemal dynein light chain domain containing 1 n=1 Tax=Kryptolebias marmoratus TaxID=37003 RepID=A0A3Q3EW91_KRYMA